MTSKVVGHLPITVNTRRHVPEVTSAIKMRVLDFDIEARPLGWLGQDYMHSEITAIASAWIVGGRDSDMEVGLLTKRESSAKAMLRGFKARYDEADMVVGHYIREFDLPRINAALIEFSLPTLGEKLTHDTKNDLIKHQGMSKSQENLAEMFGLDHPKVHMNVPRWRKSNRLTEEGLQLTRERAAGDVVQNIELRKALLEAHLLGAPKMWRPND